MVLEIRIWSIWTT